MDHVPPRAPQVAADVWRIAAMPGPVERRAEAILEPLSRVMPFQAAWISLFDADNREHLPLVSQGYPDGLRRYMTSPDGAAEFETLGLTRPGTVTSLRDLGTPLEELRSWNDYLAPAGFHDGAAVALFAPEGRYLGVLGLHTDSRGQPTAAARNMLCVLLPAIAQAIDPMRMLGAQAAAALTATGRTLPLPGLPAHTLLDAGSAVVAEASAHLTAHHEFVTFLSPYPTADPHGLRRITVLGGHPGGHVRGVLVVSRAGNMHGLVRREAEILGGLVSDCSDDRIAAALGLKPLTVAEHVEQIRIKLGASTRLAATLSALRCGLYVPTTLVDHQRLHR
jgi:DNA-binding CsgD family transcriptional regulator